MIEHSRKQPDLPKKNIRPWGIPARFLHKGVELPLSPAGSKQKKSSTNLEQMMRGAIEEPNKPLHRQIPKKGAPDEYTSKDAPSKAPGGTGNEPPRETPRGGAAELPGEGHIKHLEDLIGYLSKVAPVAFGSFFVALLKKENLHPSSEPSNEEGLAAFDIPSTEKSKLQFNQELVAEQYRQTLQATGLEFSKDVFLPGLAIADGELFAETLANIPKGNKTLKKGVEDIVRHSLTTIRLAHVPNIDSEDYNTAHLHPKLQPEVTTNKDTFNAYNKVTTQTLLNARDIAAQLEHLEINPKVIRGLKTAHTAEIEKMLPEWAIAENFGLYNQPTTHWLDLEWTQWATKEEWQKLHDFVDNAAAKAPANSRFLNDLATSMLTNISKLRKGDLAPTERQVTKFDYEKDDDFFDFAIKETPEMIARNQEDEREYATYLAAAEKKLQKFSHT
ncbi:MAG TPA: hypothetical protein VE090_03015 [Methylomirabilota bacterium]|nr:hypothetical protein [Methylomirabilota bacterium]